MRPDTIQRGPGRPRLTPLERWERRVRKSERLVCQAQGRAGRLETPYDIGRLLVARRALHALYSEGMAAGHMI